MQRDRGEGPHGGGHDEHEAEHADDEAGTLTEPRENIVLFCGRYDTDGTYRYKFYTKTINSKTGRAELHYIAPEEIFDTGRAVCAA